MGVIRYKVNSGVLPMTVSLIGGEGTIINTHTAYDEQEFVGTFSGSYELKFVDSAGCEKVEIIAPCENCPGGYTPAGIGCEGEDIEDPVEITPLHPLVGKKLNVYTSGNVAFFSTMNYDGTGDYEWHSTSYWRNIPSNTTDGAMNRSAVWIADAQSNQDIKFSFCIDLNVEKIYYVGFGCDNEGTMSINGVEVLHQNTVAIATMFGNPSALDYNHKIWFIYPISLKAGRNIIEVGSHNIYGPAAVGLEIYNSSLLPLKAAANDTEANIIFRSRDLVALGKNAEQVLIGGTVVSGYECTSPGYSLSTCGPTPKCVKITKIDCPN